MPISLYPTISRRHFVRTTLAASAAGALGACSSPQRASQGTDAAASARWAFVSDTHVPKDPTNEYRGFRPYDNFQSVVGPLREARPEGIVITGDIARLEGFEGDYANVRRLIQPLRSTAPIHMCLGNHDNRENFLKALENTPDVRQPVDGKFVNVVDTDSGVRLILLDSLMYVNRVAGLLGKNQRTWLADYLSRSDSCPTILFFHHTLADGDGDLLDVDRLFAIVKPHKKVKAFMYGHSHVHQFATQDGIHLINLPATGYNFNDNDPVGWVEANLTRDGADLTLRAFAGNTANDRKTTSLAWRA